jgi:hypothetical protein
MNRNSHPFSPKSFFVSRKPNDGQLNTASPHALQKKQQSPLTTTSFVSTIILNRAINQ